MSERAIITTADHVTLELELAGVPQRLMAWLFDTFMLVLLFLLLIFLFLGLGGGITFGLDLEAGIEELMSSVGVAILVAFYFVLTWGYGVLFEGLSRGQTPGKRLMGLRVVRQDGLPIGFREAAMRNLVRAADMLPPPTYALGALVLNFDPQHRRLGDMMAGTLVVRERFDLEFGSQLGAAWAVRLEQGQSRQALSLPGGALTAQQLELIEQYLSRRTELTDQRREALAKRLGEPLLILMGREANRRNSTDFYEALMAEVLGMAEHASSARNVGAKRVDGLF